MIYLPIKEARKYLKRETGIRFSDYELAKLSVDRYVRCFLDDASLVDGDVSIYLSQISQRLRDAYEGAEGADSFHPYYSHWGFSAGGYTELLYPSFPRKKDNTDLCYRETICCHQVLNVRTALGTILHIVSREETHEKMKDTLKNPNQDFSSIRSETAPYLVAQSGNIENIFFNYFKKKALLFSMGSLNHALDGEITNFKIKELFFRLDELQHLAKYLTGTLEWTPLYDFSERDKEVESQQNNVGFPPSPKTINKQEEVIASLALLYLKGEHIKAPDKGHHAAAETLIQAFQLSLPSYGVNKAVVSQQALADYIKNGLSRLKD